VFTSVRRQTVSDEAQKEQRRQVDAALAPPLQPQQLVPEKSDKSNRPAACATSQIERPAARKSFAEATLAAESGRAQGSPYGGAVWQTTRKSSCRGEKSRMNSRALLSHRTGRQRELTRSPPRSAGQKKQTKPRQTRCMRTFARFQRVVQHCTPPSSTQFQPHDPIAPKVSNDGQSAFIRRSTTRSTGRQRRGVRKLQLAEILLSPEPLLSAAN
jgi:hypothetical protein